MGAPTDLEDLGYGRGFLRPGPAASVRRLDVILGRPLDINSAYRDWHAQMRLYLAYQRDPKNNPLALHPDYSWHCKGMAVDTDDRLAIFREHGWLFEVAGEPWHGQYYTSLDKHYGEPAGGNAKPLPTPQKDDNMPIIIAQRANSQLAKGLYDSETGKITRELSKAENNLLRSAQADGGKDAGTVLYGTIGDADYAALKG